jgi:hypothetical protein
MCYNNSSAGASQACRQAQIKAISRNERLSLLHGRDPAIAEIGLVAA